MERRHAVSCWAPRFSRSPPCGEPTAGGPEAPCPAASLGRDLRASSGHRWEDQAESAPRLRVSSAPTSPKGLLEEGPADTPPVHIPGPTGPGRSPRPAPWRPRCLVEEEGPPTPRGSRCLHLCFLPDSDCLARSLLSSVCLGPAPGASRAGVACGPWWPPGKTVACGSVCGEVSWGGEALWVGLVTWASLPACVPVHKRRCSPPLRVYSPHAGCSPRRVCSPSRRVQPPCRVGPVGGLWLGRGMWLPWGLGRCPSASRR